MTVAEITKRCLTLPGRIARTAVIVFARRNKEERKQSNGLPLLLWILLTPHSSARPCSASISTGTRDSTWTNRPWLERASNCWNRSVPLHDLLINALLDNTSLLQLTLPLFAKLQNPILAANAHVRIERKQRVSAEITGSGNPYSCHSSCPWAEVALGLPQLPSTTVRLLNLSPVEGLGSPHRKHPSI